MATELTRDQLAALRWMNDFPSTHAGWRRNGRAAYGPPETWDAMEVGGKMGKIIIPESDWRAICDLVEGKPGTDKIFGPNAAGLAVLGIS